MAFSAQPAFRVARLLVAETYDLADNAAEQTHQAQAERSRIDHAVLLRRRALAVPSQLVQHALHSERAEAAIAQAVDRLRREIEQAHDDGYLGGRRYRRLQELGDELERSTRVS